MMEYKRDSFSGTFGGATETHWERVSHALKNYQTVPELRIRVKFKRFYLKLLKIYQTLLISSVSVQFGNSSRTKFVRMTSEEILISVIVNLNFDLYVTGHRTRSLLGTFDWRGVSALWGKIRLRQSGQEVYGCSKTSQGTSGWLAARDSRWKTENPFQEKININKTYFLLWLLFNTVNWSQWNKL